MPPFLLPPALAVSLVQVFLPAYQYPLGADVEVSHGHVEIDAGNQVLYWWHNAAPAPSQSGAVDGAGSGKPPKVVRLKVTDPRNRPGSPAAETRGVDPAHASGHIGAAERLARARGLEASHTPSHP